MRSLIVVLLLALLLVSFSGVAAQAPPLEPSVTVTSPEDYSPSKTTWSLCVATPNPATRILIERVRIGATAPDWTFTWDDPRGDVGQSTYRNQTQLCSFTAAFRWQPDVAFWRITETLNDGRRIVTQQQTGPLLKPLATTQGHALVVVWVPPEDQAFACVHRRNSPLGDAPLGCLMSGGGQVTIRNQDLNLQVAAGETVRLESVGANGQRLAVAEVVVTNTQPVLWLPILGR